MMLGSMECDSGHGHRARTQRACTARHSCTMYCIACILSSTLSPHRAPAASRLACSSGCCLGLLDLLGGEEGPRGLEQRVRAILLISWGREVGRDVLQRPLPPGMNARRLLPHRCRCRWLLLGGCSSCSARLLPSRNATRCDAIQCTLAPLHSARAGRRVCLVHFMLWGLTSPIGRSGDVKLTPAAARQADRPTVDMLAVPAVEAAAWLEHAPPLPAPP
jgi:hypothetical protein